MLFALTTGQPSLPLPLCKDQYLHDFQRAHASHALSRTEGVAPTLFSGVMSLERYTTVAGTAESVAVNLKQALECCTLFRNIAACFG